MNDLRTAAQQALEALENAEDQLAKPYSTDARKAITALRAALAQEPASDFERGFQRGWQRAMRDRDRDALVKAKVESELAATVKRLAEPVEPVAWAYMGIKQDGTEHGPHLVWKPEYMDAMSASKGAKAIPLYTAPPQRLPLTDEEVAELARQEQFLLICDGLEELTEITRAVERAHGIGGQE